MTVLSTLAAHLQGDSDSAQPCDCRLEFENRTLVVDATDCADSGRLESSPDCRESVVTALADRDVETVRVRTGGVERQYEDAAAALLVAAGRFVERATHHDVRLADRAKRDPLGAAREATGRADATAAVAAQTGLGELSAAADCYESALAPVVGLRISRWRVDTTPPLDGRLVRTKDLDTGATVRHYERESGQNVYALDPLEHSLDESDQDVVADAYERLAAGTGTGGERAATRAVHEVSTDDTAVEDVVRVLRKHTRGYGLLADFFADDAVSDVFVTAPAPSNPLRVRVGDETMATNVRVTDDGVAALASRFRQESGRGFSRAEPTLDAATTIRGRRVRVAGITEPTSEGTAFAFRAHDREIWTLPALVANETLTPRAAGLLSLAVERGRSLLVAGPRGAGKTTLLGALLWEIPPAVRAVLIEDAPELPVEPLQTAGRDVQALRTGEGNAELGPAETLRTALRLGNGALVVGEVRGEDARVLYEAMRVGANSEAVLGTIHGDGAEATYERVVSDLGVPASSFGATDLVVTLEIADDTAETRRVRTIEEVVTGETPTFEALYDRSDGSLSPTGRIDRGNSHIIDRLRNPAESYARVRDLLSDRSMHVAELAETGGTEPRGVTPAVD